MAKASVKTVTQNPFFFPALLLAVMVLVVQGLPLQRTGEPSLTGTSLLGKTEASSTRDTTCQPETRGLVTTLCLTPGKEPQQIPLHLDWLRPLDAASGAPLTTCSQDGLPEKRPLAAALIEGPAPAYCSPALPKDLRTAGL